MMVLNVTPLEATNFGDSSLRSWLGRTKPELFQEYLRPTAEARSRVLIERFSCLLAPSKAAEIRACRRGEILIAVLGCEKLLWDSQHFGISCGRLSPYCLASTV